VGAAHLQTWPPSLHWCGMQVTWLGILEEEPQTESETESQTESKTPHAAILQAETQRPILTEGRSRARERERKHEVEESGRQYYMLYIYTSKYLSI